MKYGKLTLIKLNHRKNNRDYWDCFCDCGTECIKMLKTLKDGGTTSCGCIAAEVAIKKLKKINSKKQSSLKEENIVKQNLNFVYLRYKRSHNVKIKSKEKFITKEEFISLTQLPCFYCGKEKTNKYHLAYNDKGELLPSFEKKKDRRNSFIIFPNAYFYYNGLDRINPARGYVYENLLPCCYWCNIMKSDGEFGEFIEHLQNVFNHLKLNNPDCKKMIDDKVAELKEKTPTIEL